MKIYNLKQKFDNKQSIDGLIFVHIFLASYNEQINGWSLIGDNT